MNLCLAFFSLGSHGTLVSIMMYLITTRLVHMRLPFREWLPYIEQPPHLCPEVDDPANESVGIPQTTNKCHFCTLRRHRQVQGPPPETDQLLVHGLHPRHLVHHPDGGNVLLTAMHRPLLHLGLAGSHPQQQYVGVGPETGKLQIPYLKHCHDLISLRMWSTNEAHALVDGVQVHHEDPHRVHHPVSLGTLGLCVLVASHICLWTGAHKSQVVFTLWQMGL
jgi:hypothetical protein